MAIDEIGYRLLSPPFDREDDSMELVGAGQLIEGVTEKRLPLDEAELFQCLAPEAEATAP